MRTPTLQEFKRWSKAHYSLAHAVCVAQAFAQCQRDRVDAYIKPVFDDFSFEYGQNITRGQHTGLIASPKDLYLCEDEAGMARFYECADEAHRAHGFKGPKGHCPALVAENLQIIAENHLIEAGCELLAIERTGLYGDNRARMLDLLLGACLKTVRECERPSFSLQANLTGV